MNEKDDIMTVNEVAKYLKISEKSVIRMAQKGEIPVTKIASQWRFMKAVIDDWLISRMDVSNKSYLSNVSKNNIPLYTSRLIKPEYILMNIEPGNKETILKQLIKPLIENNLIKDEQIYLKLLIEREEIVSTAIGKGIAIPHIRNPKQYPIAQPSIIIGICKEGTNFESFDSQETYIFFLVCADCEVVHLKIMAKIAFLTKNTSILNKLKKAKYPNEIFSEIIRLDQEFEI